MEQELLTTADDCQWLRETHLKERGTPEFHSAMIYGNADCPERIELYASAEPTVDDPIVAAYNLDAESHPFVYVRVR